MVFRCSYCEEIYKNDFYCCLKTNALQNVHALHIGFSLNIETYVIKLSIKSTLISFGGCEKMIEILQLFVG